MTAIGLMSWNQLLTLEGKKRPVRSHSAEVREGDIFVAVPGPVSDGAKYIADAVHRKAFAVVSRETGLDLKSTVTVYHSDPAQALGDLACAYYGTVKKGLKVIAFTGTNGKTTCTYLMEQLLEANGFKTGVIGTVNYRWAGRVLPALNTTPGCVQLHSMLSKMAEDRVEYVCLEVSSHALEQNRLASLPVHTAVFTNLSQDHLDYHANMEDYFKAKKLLFQTGSGRNAPAGAANIDDKWGCRLLDEFSELRAFGVCPGRCAEKDICYELLASTTDGLAMKMQQAESSWTLKSGLVGDFNASNLAAVQAAGSLIGMEPEELSRVGSAGAAPGRMQRIANGCGLNVYVDYAHTPDALENALSSLRQLSRGRLLVVFGCGGERDQGKRHLMGAAASAIADEVIVTSDNPRRENPLAIIDQIMAGTDENSQVQVVQKRDQAIERALSQIGKNDILLIAGKGHENYQQIGTRKLPFSDYDFASEILRKMSSKGSV